MKRIHNTAFVCPFHYCFSCSRYHFYYFILQLHIIFSSITMYEQSALDSFQHVWRLHFRKVVNVVTTNVFHWRCLLPLLLSRLCDDHPEHDDPSCYDDFHRRPHCISPLQSSFETASADIMVSTIYSRLMRHWTWTGISRSAPGSATSDTMNAAECGSV